jgi:hypothetical protein
LSHSTLALSSTDWVCTKFRAKIRFMRNTHGNLRIERIKKQNNYNFKIDILEVKLINNNLMNYACFKTKQRRFWP